MNYPTHIIPDVIKNVKKEYILCPDKKGNGKPIGIGLGWCLDKAYKNLFNSHYHIQCHYFLKNSGFAVIDIDCSTYTVDNLYNDTGIDCNFTLYYIGNTKGLHLWINSDRVSTNFTKCGLPEKNIDYLGSDVWEKIDKVAINPNLMCGVSEEQFNLLYDSNVFNKPPKTTTLVQYDNKPTEGLEQIIELIDIQYLDDYDDWKRIVWAGKNSGMTEALLREISMKSSKYSEDGFELVWSGECHDLTEGTIHYYAKLSNETQYLELFANEESMDLKRLICMKPNNTVKSNEDNNYHNLNKSAQKQVQANYEKEQAELLQQEIQMKTSYFEKFHFKLMNPPCFGRTAYNETHLLSNLQINLLYENVLLKDSKSERMIPFTTKWREQSCIRSYENINFLPPPNTCPKYTFNSFNGLRAEKLTGSGDIQPFLQHLRILTNHNDKGYEYMLDYMAHMVQKPGELPRVAILFQSDEGTGKNLFFENFCNKIFGNEYLLVACEMDKVVGRFSMINNKLMVILDETRGKDSFSNSEKIKSIITSEEIAWERKGVDGIKLNNCGRYLFFSNNEVPIKISNSDRRFVVFKTPNDVKGNIEYFKNLTKQFKNDGCIRSFYEFLMTRDISEWDSELHRPITKEYLLIQSATIPVMATWLNEYVMNYKTAEKEEQNIMDNKTSVMVFKDFTNWLQENGFEYKYNITSFGRELNNYDGIVKKRTSKGTVYLMEYDKIEQYLIDKKWIE